MARPLRIVFSLLALAGSACALSSPTPPMRSLRSVETGPGGAEGLVVLLPGLGGGPWRFRDNGVMTAIQGETGYDVVAPRAHFGFYRHFTVIERLHEDIIGPARVAGYRKLWLVGVSMGGFGALMYAEEHPERVAGVFVVAPFLGEGAVLDEIRRTEGGLAHWEPGDLAAMAEGRPRKSREVWAWIKRQLYGPAPRVPIYLAYGRDDRSAEDHALLGRELPEDHVVTRAGGHKWKVWRHLVHSFVDGVLARPAGSSNGFAASDAARSQGLANR
jgi:pimeloyl-ACP methyl ester carboxylesterase